MTGKAIVSVPATTANLGPGLDCLGLDLNLRDRIRLGEITDRLDVELLGEGASAPLVSGLGNNTTAVLGGMLAANAITGSPLGQNKVLELAAGLEDHPANVSPALSGGLTIRAATESGLAGERVHVPDLRVVVALPDHDLPSVTAWKAFPRQVSLPMQSSTSDGSAWCFERRRAVTTIGWQILRRPVDYRRRRQKPSTRLVYVCSIFR